VIRKGLVRVTAVAVAIGLSSSLTGCNSRPDDYAGDLAERTAIAMADDIAPSHSPESLSGEHLAWLAISQPRLPLDPEVDYEIDAASWLGNSGDDSGAQFTVRIDVHVAAQNNSGFGGDRQESRAVRCYAFIVRAVPEWQGAVTHSGVSCPPGPYAKPQPDDLLVMPDDAESRISAVLAVATADDVEALLREQFPDEGFTISVRARDGEIVVSVFVAREPSCRVGIRAADGTITVFGVPPSALLPGESDCDVRYYSP
jgi:hypothetical protein